jgi:hypothetical protein
MTTPEKHARKYERIAFVAGPSAEAQQASRSSLRPMATTRPTPPMSWSRSAATA